MINFVVRNTLIQLIKNDIVKESDYELYRFGLKQLYNFIFDTLLTLMIGGLLNMFAESILYSASYIPLRKYAGGYHAPNTRICFIASVMMMLVSLLLIKFIEIPTDISSYIMFISSFILFIKAPVESRNKPLNEKEKRVFKRRTHIILIIECILFIMCLSAANLNFSDCVVIAVTGSAILSLSDDGKSK